MSTSKPTEATAPPCPMCSQQTYLKQTHREHLRDLLLLVFKCPSCAVEYPVAFPARE
jgi:hypothetical protein